MKFMLTPTGPTTVLQIGLYLCLFFFFSQVRNIAQQYSSSQGCAIEIGNADKITIGIDFLIAFICMIIFSIIAKQILIQYNKYKTKEN